MTAGCAPDIPGFVGCTPMPTENRVSVVIPPDVLHEIDGQRGRVSRSAWIVQACRGQLAHDELIEPSPPPRATGLAAERARRNAPGRPLDRTQVEPIVKGKTR